MLVYKVEHYSFQQFSCIILPIMLTDFTYSQNYAWFNAHGILDS